MMDFQFHPLADLFPLLEGQEFDDLVADIKKNGLREPITLLGSRILDGRNRYRACLKAGVEVRHRDFYGDNAAAFVVSMNLHRRQLNESQRALVAVKIANLKRGGDRQSEETKSANLRFDVSRASAAKVLNISERSIDSAAALVKTGVPELVQAVERGEVRLSRATRIAALPAAKQRVMAIQISRAPTLASNRIESAERWRGQSQRPQRSSSNGSDSARLRNLSSSMRSFCLGVSGRLHQADRSLSLPDQARYAGWASARR
jgi:ParB-like chromosome segregation protein Spo0J